MILDCRKSWVNKDWFGDQTWPNCAEPGRQNVDWDRPDSGRGGRGRNHLCGRSGSRDHVSLLAIPQGQNAPHNHYRCIQVHETLHRIRFLAAQTSLRELKLLQDHKQLLKLLKRLKARVKHFTLWCQLEDMFQLIVMPQGIEKVKIQLIDRHTCKVICNRC